MTYDKESLNQILENCLSVKEFINILQKYPPEMKIITTWESTVHALEEQNIYESKEGHLYLDADYNFYKNQFSK